MVTAEFSLHLRSAQSRPPDVANALGSRTG
jgi:hypothetical protein